MAILMDAGVVDTGAALVVAARWGGEEAVKLLLQRRQVDGPPTGSAEYANFCDVGSGHTPLFCSIDVVPDGGVVRQSLSLRVVRTLIDAGADATPPVRVQNIEGDIYFCGTLLAYTNNCLREKEVHGKDATQEQLEWMEAVRRMLLRLDAIHAVSWLWPADARSAQRAEEHDASEAKETVVTPLGVLLPVLRRRARRRGLVMAPLLRLVVGWMLRPLAWQGISLCAWCNPPLRVFAVVGSAWRDGCLGTHLGFELFGSQPARQHTGLAL